MAGMNEIKVGRKFVISEECLKGKLSKAGNGNIAVYTITDVGDKRVKAKVEECIGNMVMSLDVDLPIYSFLDTEFAERNEYMLATVIKMDEDKEQEQVNHPSHYSWLKDLCGVEPLDICRHLDFNVGCAIKYLLRKDKVDGSKTKIEKRIEDLEKAKFYIEDEIKLLNAGKK